MGWNSNHIGPMNSFDLVHQACFIVVLTVLRYFDLCSPLGEIGVQRDEAV